MPIDARIDDIVSQLGRFYGAVSRDAFVSLLINQQTDLPPNLLEPARIPTETQAARAIINVTEGAFTTPTLISEINALYANAPDEQKQKMRQLIKICYETTVADEAGVILKKNPDNDTRPQVRTSNRDPASVVVQGTDGADHYSIKGLIGAAGVTNFNSTGAPSPNSKTMSVIQVFGKSLSPANRDTGSLTLFMNAIPTIEMSRAVPFIDIVLIQEGAPIVTTAGESQGRIRSLSLGQFLMGNAQVTPNTTESTIVGARDLIVTRQNETQPEFGESPISTAGMELFTAPQTLVPADESYEEYTPLAEGDTATSGAESVDSQVRRQAPIIDKFRPLMTLKSLSFSVVPSGGMMSYKTAQMTITVHDRSRLAEVADFVRPARYGRSHLLMEYGWSHPDGSSYEAGSSSSSSNLYGQFINSLRTREKYQVVNSSFSFDDAGQVEVQMSLAMLSSRASTSVQVGLNFESSTAYRNVKNTTDMIQQIRQRMGTTTAASITGEADVLGSLTDPTSALSLSPEVIQEINNIVTASRRSGSGVSADLRDLGDALNRLVGSTTSTSSRGARRAGIDLVSSDSELGALRTSIRDTISTKIAQMRETADPFYAARDSTALRTERRRAEAAARAASRPRTGSGTGGGGTGGGGSGGGAGGGGAGSGTGGGGSGGGTGGGETALERHRVPAFLYLPPWAREAFDADRAAAESAFNEETFAVPRERNRARRARIAEIDEQLILQRRLSGTSLIARSNVRDLEAERLSLTNAIEPESL